MELENLIKEKKDEIEEIRKLEKELQDKRIGLAQDIRKLEVKIEMSGKLRKVFIRTRKGEMIQEYEIDPEEDEQKIINKCNYENSKYPIDERYIWYMEIMIPVLKRTVHKRDLHKYVGKDED